MPIPARHIIQRQTVWMDPPQQLPAFVLQERLSVYCRNILPGVLESVFDGIADADTIIRVDTLDLDAGTISLARFDEQLTQRIRQQAEQELTRLLNNREPGDTRVERYSRADRLGQQFRFFLHHGYLPAWADTTAFAKFSDWLMGSSAGSFRSELRTVLSGNSSMARRLISHSSDAALMHVVAPTASAEVALTVANLFQIIHQKIRHLPLLIIREQYWLNRFRAVGNAGSSEAYLTDFYESLYRLNVTANGEKNPASFFVTLFQLVDFDTKAMPSKDRDASLNTLQQLINQATIFQTNLTQQPARETLTDTESTSERTRQSDISADTESKTDPANEKPNANSQRPSATEKGGRSQTKAADSGKTTDADTIELTTAERRQSSLQAGSVHAPPMYADSLDPADAIRTHPVSKSSPKTTKQERMESSVAESEIYVSMAGIVLLHPFLTTLFTEMGLVRNRQWVSPEASEKGVQVLAWLATGTAFCAEYTMPLLKLLCGLPIDAVVSPDILLTDTEKPLTTEVLEAVLTHWTILKNTSTAGLQEAFLQREGKLTAVDGGWRLTVERKTIDILLDKLPWGVSMVKLPWMPDLLFVDWI